MPLIRDLALDELTQVILYASGQSDRRRGVTLDEGWRDVAKIGGFEQYGRTPARDRYEDGYYAPLTKGEE